MRVDVGVDRVAEMLGTGAGEVLGEVFLGGVGFVVGVGDALVVACDVSLGVGEQGGGFGVGEHDVIGVDASGELHVGGFAVEGVGADRDREVPGAALGAVAGEGVGVGEMAAALEVLLVESHEWSVVECDGDMVWSDRHHGPRLTVGDHGAVAVG